MSTLLTSLNSAQRAAVTSSAGSVLVVAGAGSGKTRVLTTRIAYLLEQGCLPSEILAFTFTNKAARQMQERVAQLVGPERSPYWIGTFHATGARILRAHADRLGLPRDFAIYDTDDQKRLLRNVLAEQKLDAAQYGLPGMRSTISTWKNDDIAPAEACDAAAGHVQKTQARVYDAYQKALRGCRALDFDDLILEAVHLLEKHADVRQHYASRFRHVLVDEFQDTNLLQLMLVRLLSSVHGSVFVVGDDDQSIYGWRGARVENMLDFERLFHGTQTYRLEQNYRSVGCILEAANAVIANNRRRKGKNLWTDIGPGDPVAVEEHADAEDEAARVVEIIGQEQARGHRLGEITVLYRTNAQSRLLEEALRRARTPHQVVGSVQFYERREVRDLLAYLKLTANPADEVSLQRIINQPRRRIGETSVARLLACAHEHALTVGDMVARPDLLHDALGSAAARRVLGFLDQLGAWRRDAESEVGVPELLNRILLDIGYAQFLRAEDASTADGRLENVAELVNLTHAFAEASDGGTLNQFLEQMALVADQDVLQDGEGAVRLMTVHTAKGLEFPVVVLTGCEDPLLPHATSSDTAAGVEEERRLFYVAMTRAMRRLYLLHAGRRRRFGAYEDSLPSRFLAELPDQCCRRHTDDRIRQGPIAWTLFGRTPERPPMPRQDHSAARLSRSSHAASPSKVTAGASAQRRGRRKEAWDEDVVQTAAYYPGQTVVHASFGTGRIARVEGQGADLTVTVDFLDHGRKHLLPRLAPLRPVD